MKNLRTIKDVEKEFDEIFGKDQYGGIEPFRQDKVKEFITSSLRTLLEQVVPEEKKMTIEKIKEEPDIAKASSMAMELGYDYCRQQTLDRIKEIFNN